MRFLGQDHTIEIAYQEGQDPIQAFRNKYSELFGHWPENKTIELGVIKILASTREISSKEDVIQVEEYLPEPDRKIQGPFDNESKDVFDWSGIQAGARIHGPAILLNENSTTVVEEGWSLLRDIHDNAILHYTGKVTTPETSENRKPYNWNYSLTALKAW